MQSFSFATVSLMVLVFVSSSWGFQCSFENGTNTIVQLGQEFNFSCSDQGGVEWSIPPSSSVSIKHISLFEKSIVSNGAVQFDSGHYISRSKINVNESAILTIYVAENTSSSAAPVLYVVIIIATIALIGIIFSVFYYRKSIWKSSAPALPAAPTVPAPQVSWTRHNSESDHSQVTIGFPRIQIPAAPTPATCSPFPSVSSSAATVENRLYGVLSPNPYSPLWPPSHSPSIPTISPAASPSPAARAIPSSSQPSVARSMMILRTDDLPPMTEIGSGQFGTVHVGELRGQKLAFKFPSNEPAYKDLLNEIGIMENLDHHHVLKLIGKVYDDSTLSAAIFELMEHGDLLNILREKPGFTQDSLLQICCDIARGMEYLQQKGIVHRDLACRNCLVGSSFVVKVSDFGLARYVHDNGVYLEQENVRIAARWMAPECLNGGVFSSKSDVWSYAVVLWEIFTGGMRPYNDVNGTDVFTIVTNGGNLNMSDIECPDFIKSISESCWKMNPEERFNFSQIRSLFEPDTNPSA